MCPGEKYGTHKCPKNTNSACQVVASKKVVSVKAWAYKSEGQVETKGWHAVPEHYDGCVPCKIVMTAANYKRLGRKG